MTLNVKCLYFLKAMTDLNFCNCDIWQEWPATAVWGTKARIHSVYEIIFTLNCTYHYHSFTHDDHHVFQGSLVRPRGGFLLVLSSSLPGFPVGTA